MKCHHLAKQLPRILPSVVVLSCLGCTDSPDATNSPSPPVSTPVEELSLEIADRAKLDEVLTAHRGNVVLVDYWSTSCIPCVEKLPAVLDLHKRLGERGLRVVTVSLDDPDTAEDIRTLLHDRGATSQHLISKFGSSPKSLEEFEIDLVPHYRLYNRGGELVEVFESGPDEPPLEFANIEAAVERLL